MPGDQWDHLERIVFGLYKALLQPCSDGILTA